MEDETEIGMKWISSFWRRVGAFFIDSILLGVIGLLLGLALEDLFVEVGGWGRLIGFAIALPYFGIMNSKIAGGQTIGKRVLKLRVVNSENQPIDIIRSFIRYSVIGVPFFLNGAQFTNEALLSFWLYPLSFIVFGGFFSLIYLYIFNRVTRQSLHDLAVGTFVVNAGVSEQKLGSIWKPHLYIVGALFVTAAVVPSFTKTLSQSEPFKGLLATQIALTNNAEVNYAAVSYGKSTFVSASDETNVTSYVGSKIFLKTNTVSNVELARELAKIILNNYPQAKNKNLIQVNLRYGYDIGIASKWNNHSYSFDPGELQANE
ncbi:MAG: RDD family protein [Porticoccaceae bacterium]